MESFVLYLILVIKPRFDDTNVVNTYPTMEYCEDIAKGLNEGNDMLLAGTEPRYRWVCRAAE